jgi:hypothetical protein
MAYHVNRVVRVRDVWRVERTGRPIGPFKPFARNLGEIRMVLGR